jgi:thiamine-phosphate pyrophosphorylase
VGQDDVSVAHCRDLLGENAIIGLSTHQSSELTLGIKEPVTYLSAGPVEETPTKPGRAGTGVAYVEDAVLRSPVPVFVTGGVTASAIAKLGRTGVRRFVVVRALTESPRPLEAAKELRFAIDALEAP